MNRPARWILRAVVLSAALAGIAYVAWQGHLRWPREGEGPLRRGRGGGTTPVEVAPVERRTLHDVGLFTGTLEADSRYVVAPRISGTLKRLHVRMGDAVRAGQLLAELDDLEFIQQVVRAKAELAVAQAAVTECRSTLLVAQREYERAMTLARQDIASQAELEQAKAQYEVQQARCSVAESQVTQRQAALREAEIRLGYTKISAQWPDDEATAAAAAPDNEAGVTDAGDAPAAAVEIRYVGQRFVDEGALLSTHAPIITIVDIDPLIGVIQVIERDYARIAVGQPVTITTDAHGERTFTGTIARIAPLLQESSRQGRVEIRIDNADRALRPGMFIRARLQFAVHEDVPAVPRSALARRDGRQGVFVADPDKGVARFVPLTLGIREGDLVEVVEGQLDGPVVTMGQHLLEDGGKISLVSTVIEGGADAPAPAPGDAPKPAPEARP